MTLKQTPLKRRSPLRAYTRLLSRKRINPVGRIGRRNRADKARITPALKLRSGGRCTNCGEWPDWRGLERHRGTFGSHGGRYSPENTGLWCARCHYPRGTHVIGSKENAAAL